jgi:hypothetical protein
MTASVSGDAEGSEMLAAVFAENFADVWRFVRRRTVSAADADDIAAEVFAVACRRQAELPPGAIILLRLKSETTVGEHRGAGRPLRPLLARGVGWPHPVLDQR